MAASLGLVGHEAYAACSYPPPAAAASYFFPQELVADSGGAVMELPPAAAMADCYYLPEIMGARTPDYYCSPPAPVFANGRAAAAENEKMNTSYVDCDGRVMMMSGSAGSGGRPPPRIGFRTRSEVDVLDDGFKWRKYGKKAVKSSPNPRNYYRCSAEGCGVKKRVERDRDDPRYIVTTYDGVHNHAVPGRVASPGPPRGAQRPACSAPLVAAPWSAPAAPCDPWGTQLHAAAAAAAHSSESSY
ncbi:putative WRKY transcription factor 58 [Panicum miliaceum]|uniref:WRKY transcription factor 58 n=1 Tax=Panicum miliaceum TaxID=4540 RepID=A0A3L6SK85_PANMI|nr:putative WRKY transcription factor 58 [Panicum miliaceum]